MKRYKIEFSNHKLSVNESDATGYKTSHIYSNIVKVYMFTNESKLEKDLERFKKFMITSLTNDIDSLLKFELPKKD